MKLFLFLTLFISGIYAQDLATYDKALAEYKTASYQESLQTLREVFKLEKPRYELHYLAAFNYWNLKEVKPALSHFQSAIKFKPDDTKAYIDIIKLYNSAQMYKPALELCEDAVKKFPEETELKLQQVALLLKYGKLEIALDIIEKLKQSLVDDYRPLTLEANIYYIKKDFEKAEISLKWASALASNNANIKNNLALVYEQMALLNLKANEKEKAKINLELAKAQMEAAVNTSQNFIYLEKQKRINILYTN